MGSAILLLALLPIYTLFNKLGTDEIEFNSIHLGSCTIFFSDFILLGVLGSSPADEAFVIASKYACFIYFGYLII
jgi:quinol-cytochrome oxidoreductase complex cytochrome b subunit